MIKAIKKIIRKGLNFTIAFFYFIDFLFIKRRKLNKAEVVFFFPYYQTGGAERVHLNIVKSITNKKSCILFTNNSATINFYNDFARYSELIEINKILSKKNIFINKLLKKSIVKCLNNNKNLITVFGSNTNLYYQLVPYINTGIKKVDLIHAISGENKTLVDLYMTNSSYLDIRVVINNKAKSDLLGYYRLNNIDKSYNDRIAIIENGIAMSNMPFEEKLKDKIKIGFVGRWSPEKRPEIFLSIAKKIKNIKPSIEFEMVGIGMKSNIVKINNAGVLFLGEITNYAILQKFYKNLTFILITSYREGFPVVIMEAMSQGVIPISTNVGGISEHIVNYENGILINEQEEELIVCDFIDKILKLISDNKQMDYISKNAFFYAKKKFGLNLFNKKYYKILI